ncbi:MAG: SDR family oxidoreductase [Pseudomonadota bacterium]|nr:SDR family oxidoreductase [Pseudomonadota bacterium]
MSILITGGGSGIGAGTARYFAERGAKVTISGRREAKLQEVVESIGNAAAYQVGDVTSEADRRQMVDAAVAHGGGLDVLFNNAANISHGPFMEIEEQTITDIFASNVVAPMKLTQYAAPHLSKRKGAVVFVSSGHIRRALPGRAPYAASKGAIQNLTRVLAAELAPMDIRVNCVLPGAIPSEINIRSGLFGEGEADAFYSKLDATHPLGRVGTAEEIAEGVAYLSCAEWTTGAILDIDGGFGLGLMTT